MNAPRTRRGSTRLLAGLATTSLLGAGLAYVGTAPASAEEPAGIAFGFQVFDVALSGDGSSVVAVGQDDNGTPEDFDDDKGVLATAALPAGPVVRHQVAEAPSAVATAGDTAYAVGGSQGYALAGGAVQPITLPEGARVSDVLVAGDELRIFGSNELGDVVTWTTERLNPGTWAAGLLTGTPADGSVEPTAGGLLDGSPFAAGTVYGQESQMGAIWHEGTTLTLTSTPWDVVAAESTAYVATGESVARVTGGEVQEFDTGLWAASTLALAGGTLFVAGGSDIAALDTTALGSYDEENPAPSTYVDAVDTITRLLASADGRTLYALDGWSGTLVTVTAPSAPVVTHAFDHWQTGLLTLSWPSSGDLAYTVSAASETGVVPEGLGPWEGSVDVWDLTPGATYSFAVTASNGLWTSSTTHTVTVPVELTGPATVGYAGTPHVGATLTADPGAWPEGTELRYQWVYSGGEFGGLAGEGRTYQVPADLAGLTLTLRVTGAKEGFSPRTVRTQPVTVTAAPVVVHQPAPPAPSVLPVLPTTKKATAAVAGTPAVGKVVKADVGTWPKGTTITVQWYADGKPIKGGTKRSLKLTKQLKGKKVSVVVTGTKAGYAPATKKSKAAKVR